MNNKQLEILQITQAMFKAGRSIYLSEFTALLIAIMVLPPGNWLIC